MTRFFLANFESKMDVQFSLDVEVRVCGVFRNS